MVELEYVVSAWMNFNFLNTNNDELLKWSANNYEDNLKYMFKKLKGNHFEFSGLYNAYYEPKQFDNIKRVQGRKKKVFGHQFIYADSGGLQMMKQGLDITKEVKENIIDHQINNSDYAFIFDEIPAFETDKGRTYVKNWVKPYGEKTGDNLKLLLTKIKNSGSKTKALPIIQGRGHEQIQIFTKALLSKITTDEEKYIEAYALGNAHVNGFGLIQSFSSFLEMGEIKPEFKKHVHLLGITGFDRIIPILQLLKNGLFKGVEKVSFDSSYHSKTYAFGNLQKSLNWCLHGMQDDKLGLIRNKKTEEFFKEMDLFWQKSKTYNIDSFDDYFEYSSWDINGCTTPTRNLEQKGLEAYKKNVNIVQQYIFLNQYKYFEVLNAFMNDEITMKEIFHNKIYYKLYSPLERVYTLEQLREWEIYAMREFKVINSSEIDEYHSTEECANILF